MTPMTTGEAVELVGHVSSAMWSLPAIAAVGGVKFLRDIARSITELNLHIATICTRVDGHEKLIGDHEARLREGKL